VGGQFSDADLRRADAIVAISSYSTSCLTARLVRRFLLWCRIFCLTQRKTTISSRAGHSVAQRRNRRARILILHRYAGSQAAFPSNDMSV
jgi:hypothetical protein